MMHTWREGWRGDDDDDKSEGDWMEEIIIRQEGMFDLLVFTNSHSL